MRHCLGFDVASQANDERSTLVYFHWPHEHPVHGKTVAALCGRVLDDEQSARWGRLFRCVQVDMSQSDARLVQILGDVDKPTFLVLAKDTSLVARIPAASVATPGKFVAALQAAHAKFPDEAKRIEKEVADQDRTLAKARAAAKADRLEDALSRYDEIRASIVRIGPNWDRAVQEAGDLEKRIERERAKDGDGPGGDKGH